MACAPSTVENVEHRCTAKAACSRVAAIELTFDIDIPIVLRPSEHMTDLNF